VPGSSQMTIKGRRGHLQGPQLTTLSEQSLSDGAGSKLPQPGSAVGKRMKVPLCRPERANGTFIQYGRAGCGASGVRSQGSAGGGYRDRACGGALELVTRIGERAQEFGGSGQSPRPALRPRSIRTG
jgi:hypothetical protein